MKGGCIVPNVKDQPKERVLRRYPYLAGMFVFCILAGFIQVLVILDCFFPLIEYTPDAVGSVMSTCSEVLAGLYCITLTGYIFFADRF